MIRHSNSPPRTERPGLNHCLDPAGSGATPLTRATRHANRLRFGLPLAQSPIQAHGQTASQGYFSHAAAAPEFQTLILATQFGIEPCGCLRRFHQQRRSS